MIINIICMVATLELEIHKEKCKAMEDATESLRREMEVEKSLKIKAVNKVAELMMSKDQNSIQKRKATSDELREKEKECRKLHQELGAVSWIKFIAMNLFLSLWKVCHLRIKRVNRN